MSTDDTSAIVKTFFDESTNTISHVLHDPVSRNAAIFDPVLDYDAASGRTNTTSADKLVTYIQSQGLNLKYIIETHAHADHLSSAPYLKEKLGGQTMIGARIDKVQDVFGKVFNAGETFAPDGSQFDILSQDGDVFSLGTLSMKAIYTPGHTPACVSYHIGNAVFVGDTLFMPDYGTARCDFPGGDAETLYQSVQKIFQLPETTRLYMCHDYKAPGRAEYAFETTVAEEKAHNIHVKQDISQEEFVRMRSERDATLDMPRLILPAVQVNMRAGHMPKADDNGQVYLKVPVNLF